MIMTRRNHLETFNPNVPFSQAKSLIKHGKFFLILLILMLGLGSFIKIVGCRLLSLEDHFQDSVVVALFNPLVKSQDTILTSRFSMAACRYSWLLQCRVESKGVAY